MTTPFDQNFLDVGDGHKIHYAQYGHTKGDPVLVIHGGPGSKSSAASLNWFDLQRYRVILYDQRGCGLSLPRGHLPQNNTAALIKDIELLRQHLHINQWLVVGGSWGACLALLYAGAYTSHLKGLILRGVFLASQRELDWFFQGLRLVAPAAWEELTRSWNTHQKKNVLLTLQQAILHGTELEAKIAAQRWHRYETHIVALTSPDLFSSSPTFISEATEGVLASYTIQAHYLAHHCYTSERQVFRQASKLKSLPVTLVHGTMDLICPPLNAMRLNRFIPHAKLQWVKKGGHIGADSFISKALYAAVREMEK